MSELNGKAEEAGQGERQRSNHLFPHWWQGTLAILGLIVGGFLLSIVGVTAKLSGLSDELHGVKADQRSLEHQVERIEQKLDRLIEALPRK